MKEFKTTQEQIERLKEHNIIVDESAEDILTTVNYYKIGGYWYQFADNEHNKCLEPIKLVDIYDLYLFDMEFKASVMWIIGHLEIKIRRSIAYNFGKAHGGLCYLDINNFNIKDKHIKFNFDKLNNLINNELEHNKNHPVVIHHRTKKGNNFPIWVIIEFLSIGSVVKLYNMLQKPVKATIAKDLNCLLPELSKFLCAIQQIRNICAHFNRLYNLDLIKFKYINGTKIFDRLLIIKRMLNNNEIWNDFIKQITIIISRHPNIDLNCLGFPSDWNKIL